MTKSEQYNLYYSTYEFKGTIIPRIGCSLINGSTKNDEIASFLEPNGIVFTQNILDEISSLNFDLSFEDYNIWAGNENESVEIKNPPAKAVFNTGGRVVEIPIADFIQILQEWKAFLQTISEPHWLSNR